MAIGANAQGNELKQEIGLSYGRGVSLIGEGIFSSLGNALFNHLSDFETTDGKGFGTLSFEYFYHLGNPRWAVGGIATYSQNVVDVVYKKEKIGERTNFYLSFMPSVKYYWVNKDKFGLYSKAAVGVMIVMAKAKSSAGESDSHADAALMFQTSLLGIEGGLSKLRVFAEVGAGEQGFALAGLRYKF